MESRDLYRAIVENSPDAVCVLDADGKIFYSNRKADLLFGSSDNKDIIGQPVTNFLVPPDCSRIIENIAGIRKGLKNFKAGYCFLRKDGSRLNVETTSSFIETKDVSPAILMEIRDADDRNQTEEKLAHLASFPENNTEPIAELHESGSVVYINPTAKRLFPDILTSGCDHPFLKDWKNLLDNFLNKDAQPVTREIFVDNNCFRQNIFYLQSYHTIRFYGQNITKYKKFEEALQQSENELELIINSTPALISYIDTDFHYRRVNKNYERWFGFNVDSMQGRHMRDVYGEKEWLNVKPQLEEVLNGKKVINEIEVHLPDGQNRWIQRTFVPDYDLSGHIRGIVAHAVDITDLKKAEEELTKAQADLENRIRQQTQELRAANELLHIEIEGHKKTYDELKQSEIRYRTAIDFTYSWEYWIDPEGKYIYVSPSCERISEYSSEEFLENKELLESIIHKDDRASFSNHLQKGETEDGLACAIDFRLIMRSGRECWIHHMCQPVYGIDGQYLGRRASNRDITENKKAEEALKAAGTYNRNLIETSLDPLVTIGPDGKITDVNTATEIITGFDRRELIGTDFADYFTQPEKARSVYKQVFEKGIVRDYPLEIRHRTGSITPVLYNASLYRDSKKNVIGVFAAARDITELKKAEGALKAAGAYNRSLIETSLDPLVTIGPDGKITDVNTATETVTGFGRSELIGTDFADYFTEPENARAGYKQVFEKGFVRDYPLEIRHRDGSITSVLYNASVYRDKNKNVIGVFAAARDITERKKAETELSKYHEHLEELVSERTRELEKEITERKKVEKALEESREGFRLITQTTPVLISVSRISEGTILFANPAYEKTFGYSEGELIGRSAEELYYDPDDRAVLLKIFKEQGFVRDHEVRVKHKDGTPFWILSSVQPISFSGREALLDASIDITDRRKAEVLIQQQVEYTMSLINKLPGLFYAIDENANMLQTNDRFTEVLGYSPEEIKTMKAMDFFTGEDKNHIEASIKNVFERGETYVEADIQSKKGDVIPYYFTGSLIIKDDKPILIGMGIDITEQKHREEIIEASLKEKEVLLKEIHHRVKNNLQIISSILNLQSTYIKDKKAMEAFRESQNRIKSMSLLHEKLYKSRYLHNINIKDYINEITANLFSSYYYESKNINLNLNSADLDLEIDKCIGVGLILNELISNSLKHGFKDKAKGEINIYLAPENDQSLLLIYSDDGIGMPAGFDYRNTETLGLHLILSLVEQHNGTMELDNSVGVKFTFSLKL